MFPTICSDWNCTRVYWVQCGQLVHTVALPLNSFRTHPVEIFLQGFVDDLSIFPPKNIKQAEKIHCLCIEAVFCALQQAGWFIKLEVSTFMNYLSLCFLDYSGISTRVPA